MKKQIITSKAPRAIGPYSQAIEAGDFIFGSGQIPADPATGDIVSGDIRAQTARVMDNIGAVLKQSGLSFNNIVQCTVFVKSMDDYAAINEVYAGYFEDVEYPPARALVEVSRLPKNVNIEIAFTAVRA